MARDWEAIKKEYIETSIGMRPLAEKHGVSFDTLKWRAKHEHWSDLRDQFRIETGVQAVKKPTKVTTVTTVTTITTPKPEEVEDLASIFRVADKGLHLVEGYLDSLELIDPQQFSQLMTALTKMRDVKDIRSALDRQEQKARIANLEKQTEIAAREPVQIDFSRISEGDMA